MGKIKKIIYILKEQKMIYLKDNHGHSLKTPFLFKTDCWWSEELLEKLSWSTPGAGRIATGFIDFKDLLNERGFTCTLIKEYKDCEKNAWLYKKYKIIKGATGNY